MKKKFIFLLFILPVLLFLRTETYQAQTVIREKVELKPSAKDNSVKKTTQESMCSVVFELERSKSTYEAQVYIFHDNVTEVFGWQTGGLISFSTDAIIEDSIGFGVKINLVQFISSDFTYRIIIDGVVVQTGSSVAHGSATAPYWCLISFEPVAFSSFNLLIGDTQGIENLTGSNALPISIEGSFDCSNNENISMTTPIILSFEPSDVNLEFVNSSTGYSMGSSFTTSINDINNNGYKIFMNSCYMNTEMDTVIVVATVSDLTKKDTIIVEPNLTVSFEDSYSQIIAGETTDYSIISNILEKNECIIDLPDTLTYNAEVYGDSSLGYLKNPLTGETGIILSGLKLICGISDLIYVSDSSVTTPNNVFLRLSSNDGKIIYDELEINVVPNRIIIEFGSAKIKAGDTTSISLKYINSNGGVCEFNQDQTCLLSVDTEDGYFLFLDPWTGEEVPYYSIPYVSGSYKFVASNYISQDSIKANVYAIIYLDDERIYGKGSITLKNLYVNAYFDNNLGEGDTSEIKINLVDSEGNIRELPDTTHFEVGIKQGCDIGEILSVNGETGQYFFGLERPIRFIVNDSLDTDIESLQLRLGISLYKYEKPPIIIGKILENDKEPLSSLLNVKKNSREINRKTSEINETYCSTTEFIYEKYGLAIGKSNDCSGYPCETNDPPKAPTFSFKMIPAELSAEKEFCDRKKIIDGYDYYEIGEIGSLDKPFESFDTLACYNKSLNKWIIKPNVENTLVVQLMVFWCEDNISKQWEKPINSINELEQIQPELICKALMDFVYQRNSYRKGTTYAIKKVMVQHEAQHIKDFEILYGDLYKEFDFAKKYLQLEKSCEGFKNIAQLKIDASYDINRLLDNFVLKVKDRELKEMGTEDNEGNPDATRRKYEEETQFTAFRNYGIDYMIQLYKLGKEKGQGKCVKAIKDLYPGLFKRG